MNNDGGPAFPRHTVQLLNGENEWGQEGLSLRDYFAAKAMQGRLANSSIYRRLGAEHEDVATDAYRWADAMLKERLKS